MTIRSCQLTVSDLRVCVHLGCSDEEKRNAQPVSIDIILQFFALPTGAITDGLDDTICYYSIVELVKDSIQNLHFNLVERLGYYIHDIISKYCKQTKNIELITVKVTKVAPPVAGICGGVSFTYSASP